MDYDALLCILDARISRSADRESLDELAAKLRPAALRYQRLQKARSTELKRREDRRQLGRVRPILE